jgi:hypothetical protein
MSALIKVKLHSNTEVLARPPISLDDYSNGDTAFPARASSEAAVRPESPPPIITTKELSEPSIFTASPIL